MTITTRIETFTLAHQSDLYVLDCASCGLVFAIPKTMEARRRKDGIAFYCPNGHSNRWFETEEDRQRKRAEAAARSLTWEKQRRDQAEAEAKHMRSVAAGHKGAHQRTKNRIAKGVCPCCNRQFVNLERHMQGQHPNFGNAPSGSEEER